LNSKLNENNKSYHGLYALNHQIDKIRLLQ
jgi:hypothetical protein